MTGCTGNCNQGRRACDCGRDLVSRAQQQSRFGERWALVRLADDLIAQAQQIEATFYKEGSRGNPGAIAARIQLAHGRLQAALLAFGLRP